MATADYWIKNLDLLKHPEGGYYTEIYRSEELISVDGLPQRFPEKRVVSTSIYFLLKGNQASNFHRIKSDEIWHFYKGSGLTIHIISPTGDYSQLKLGDRFEQGESLQCMVPYGHWFGATVDIDNSYTLVGCTVSPGFDFSDFELGDRSGLIESYPAHREIITKLTNK